MLLIPHAERGKGVLHMHNNIIQFFMAVMASVVSYYICKWLDAIITCMSN